MMMVKATSFPSSQTAPILGSAPREPSSRWRRPGFWSALAGMAAAVALACAIVATEMAGQFGQSASHFRRRADRLQARLGQVEQRLTRATREVAEMRQQAATRELFNRIVAAPDSQMVRLEPTDRHQPWHGALAFSRHLSQAILEVSALPDNDPARFTLSWIRRQGNPIRAAQFAARDPGEPEVVVQLAPPPVGVDAVVVERAAPNKPSDQTTPRPLLRGELPKPGKR